ncbi:MAG TPA: hypothetical protein VFX86_01865 [Candidatus Saccharimonadales bacterium]|nr:hypothetical protein [Candidatus Saccharimonadales bacterium]
MANLKDGFESVPSRLILSGEGLSKAGLSQLNRMVRIWRAMGINVKAEDDTDIPIDEDYFKGYAESNPDVSSRVATMTWNSLIKNAWTFREPTDDLEQFPYNIAIDGATLSYNGLYKAVREGTLGMIPRIGEASEDYVRGVLSEVETNPPENPPSE